MTTFTDKRIRVPSRPAARTARHRGRPRPSSCRTGRLPRRRGRDRHRGGRSQPRAEQEVARHPGKSAVAIVIDDLVSMSPWTPRGLEIRGSVRPERPLKPNVRAERRVGGLIRAGRITGRWPRVRNTSARRGGRKRLMPSVKPADRSPPNIRADVLDGARGFAPTNRRTGP